MRPALPRLRFPVCLLLSCVVVAAAPGPAPVEAQEAAAGRAAALVLDTGRFALHSDFRFNLHDSLYWRARPGGPADEGADCLRTLAPETRAAWERAEDHYAAAMVDRDSRTDPLTDNRGPGSLEILLHEPRTAFSGRAPAR